MFRRVSWLVLAIASCISASTAFLGTDEFVAGSFGALPHSPTIRIFAIIIDQPQEQPKDINPNQTLRLTEAVIRDPAFLANLPGAPLERFPTQD